MEACEMSIDTKDAAKTWGGAHAGGFKISAAIPLILNACKEIDALRADVRFLSDCIRAAEKPWVALVPGIPWEGGIDAAMTAACEEIGGLRAENEKLRVEVALRESRVAVAGDVAREASSDGFPRGGCKHASSGMCQACTFGWMVNELTRMRTENEGLKWLNAIHLDNLGKLSGVRDMWLNGYNRIATHHEALRVAACACEVGIRSYLGAAGQDAKDEFIERQYLKPLRAALAADGKEV